MQSENNSPETPQRRNGKFAPGVSGNPRGRPRGTRNKVSESIRAQFAEALERLGGVDYLVEVGRKHPRLFVSVIARVMPKEIHAQVSNAPLGDPEVLELMKVEWAARKRALDVPAEVVAIETKA